MPDASLDPPPGEPRADLRADCSRCVALCCVAPAFAASADFAIDKPAGRPCPNLTGTACGIHAELAPRGFPGCEVFDCFGAGQALVQATLGADRTVDWRASPATAEALFGAFPVVRQLHELLWHLVEADERLPDGALREQVRRLQDDTRRRATADADALRQVDPGALRAEVGPLLEQVSEVVRAGLCPAGQAAPDRRDADLVGADLHRADLRGTSLRGASLLGADLRGADLRGTDLLGADLRGADVRGARLDGSVFLTSPQVAAARGDTATTLPAAVVRPASWSRAPVPLAPPTRRAAPRGGRPRVVRTVRRAP